MMKILFICGSLEDGRDGVGDYTRRLAVELIRMGNIVTAVAINDQFIERKIICEQEVDGISLDVVRLPGATGLIDNFRSASKIMTEFNPSWVSLQFVPFSFSKKGIPVLFSYLIRRLLRPVNSQIMFHELWVGHASRWNEKSFWLGKLQKKAILSFIHASRPKLLVTQAPYYKYLLGQEFEDVKILPLFGNITNVLHVNATEFFNTLMRPALASKVNIYNSVSDFHIGVIFGAAPITGEMNQVARIWNDYLLRIDKQGIVILAGRGSQSSAEMVSSIENIYSRISFINLGPLDSVKLSTLFSVAQFGISPVPLALYQKSGTIAALTEHGLPVIITRMGRIQKEFIPTPSPMITYLNDLSADFFENRGKAIPGNRLKETANSFINMFKDAIEK